MMGVGFGEMILLAGIALVVIGPDKFPEFAKIVLRTIRDLRGYVEDTKRDIAAELRPVQREIQQLSRYNPEDYIESLADSVMKEEKPAETRPDEAASVQQSPAAEEIPPAPVSGAEEVAAASPARRDDNSQDEYWADIEADSDNAQPDAPSSDEDSASENESKTPPGA